MWLLKIHSGKTQLSAFHSSSVTPPPGASGGSTCNAENELLTSKDPISHVSRWVKLLHGANDIETDERWGEKRLSYSELHSKFGSGKFRDVHFAF